MKPSAKEKLLCECLFANRRQKGNIAFDTVANAIIANKIISKDIDAKGIVTKQIVAKGNIPMIKIWDLATRLYHWLQALLVFVLLLTGLNGAGSTLLHQGSGAVLFLLLIWRIIWGMVGSETSRFANFIPSARRLLSYLRGKATDYTGHNPAGGAMVLLMLSLLIFQVATGLVISEWIDSRSLLGRQIVRTVETLHALSSWLLCGAITLHIGAIALYRWAGKPLVRTMITGYQASSGKAPVIASHRRAGAVLLLSLLLSAGLLLGVSQLGTPAA